MVEPLTAKLLMSVGFTIAEYSTKPPLCERKGCKRLQKCFDIVSEQNVYGTLTINHCNYIFWIAVLHNHDLNHEVISKTYANNRKILNNNDLYLLSIMKRMASYEMSIWMFFLSLYFKDHLHCFGQNWGGWNQIRHTIYSAANTLLCVSITLFVRLSITPAHFNLKYFNIIKIIKLGVTML